MGTSPKERLMTLCSPRHRRQVANRSAANLNSLPKNYLHFAADVSMQGLQKSKNKIQTLYTKTVGKYVCIKQFWEKKKKHRGFDLWLLSWHVDKYSEQENIRRKKDAFLNNSHCSPLKKWQRGLRQTEVKLNNGVSASSRRVYIPGFMDYSCTA